LEFGPLQSLSSVASARPSLLRPGPSEEESRRSRTLRVCLSWGSCSRGHNYVGCPAPTRASLRSPVWDEDRQTLVGAVLRVLAPLDGSGFSHGLRRAPDASRPCFMPLASLELPSRAFPSRGAAPALAGRCFLAGSLSDHRQRSACRVFTTAFPWIAPALCRTSPPEGRPGTHEPGRRFPAVASPVASTRRSVPHVPSPLHRRWAHRLMAGTPASKLCSPRESVPRRPQSLARAEAIRRCSPGVLSPFRALSTTVPGSVSRVDMRVGRSPCHAHLRASSHRGCTSAIRTPTPGLASPGSVDTQGL